MRAVEIFVKISQELPEKSVKKDKQIFLYKCDGI